jgi:hypothetical protein
MLRERQELQHVEESAHSPIGEVLRIRRAGPHPNPSPVGPGEGLIVALRRSFGTLEARPRQFLPLSACVGEGLRFAQKIFQA